MQNNLFAQNVLRTGDI